jgi:hypothetical protein
LYLYILINEAVVINFIFFYTRGGVYLKFELPEDSKNRLIKGANLLRKGFAKWETLPKKTRNISAGIAFLATGIVLPKLLFVGAASTFFLAKHLYLNGEVEDAAKEIIVIHPDCDSEVINTDFGHP